MRNLIIIALCTCTVLSGCASEPKVYGMSQKQYEQLNPQQQHAVQNAYEAKQRRNQLLGAAFGAAAHAMPRHEKTLSSHQECHKEGNKTVCTSSSSGVHWGGA